MRIVILDGYTANPGDLSWDALESFGHLTVYDRTAPEEVVARAKDADVVLPSAHRYQPHRALCPAE